MLSLDTIRLSEKQKNQLIALKKKTGIDNWNILCRWALCKSLSDSTSPPEENILSNSNVELSWKVFGGEFEGVYRAILIQKFKDSNSTSINKFLLSHLSRGINLMQNEIKSSLNH